MFGDTLKSVQIDKDGGSLNDGPLMSKRNTHRVSRKDAGESPDSVIRSQQFSRRDYKSPMRDSQDPRYGKLILD